MINRFLFRLLFLVLVGGLTGCSGDEDRNIPNVDHINIDLKIRHFEQAVNSSFKNDPNLAFQQLSESYPDFFQPVFIDRMLPSLRDTVAWNNFSQASMIQNLFDTCAIVYQDFSGYEASLTQAFQFYKNYFPNRKIPGIITYASEYNYGNFTFGEDLLGIGLDFFLGPNYPLYPPQVFPKYVQNNMTPKHLVAKTMETLINEIVPPLQGSRMLDEMVRNGKILYVLDQVLPYTPDSIKLGYTQAQTEWVNQNELRMWTFFVGEELLYATEFKKFRKYVDPSPNSPGMPAEAPGRTANYIGWQIVKQYMKRYPQVSLEKLLAETDTQKFFTRAKYKPAR